MSSGSATDARTNHGTDETPPGYSNRSGINRLAPAPAAERKHTTSHERR